LAALKFLELGGIRAGFLRQPDEHFGALKIAVMVGGNIGDKVGGVTRADGVFADFNFHAFLLCLAQTCV
jgi:hypothetical protein